MILNSEVNQLSSFENFAKEAMRIIEAADRRQIPLRLMGGAAIRMHCNRFQDLYETLGRTPKHDMDFVTYGKFRPLTKRLMTELGYTPYVSLMMTGATGRNRQIFNDAEGNKAIDIFFDKLQMCHTIDFHQRLEKDSPTIPLAELLLQKMQIVELNEKDIQDTIVLLQEHSLDSHDNETINMDQLARALGDDWGFYYTVTTNLRRVKDMLPRYAAIDGQNQLDIAEKIERLLARIEEEPKTLPWKLRAKIGTSKKWYTVVEEVQR